MSAPMSVVVAFLLICSCQLALGSEQDDSVTVTDEAWFEVEIKDHDGPGKDYRGRFVVGLFGEVVPMTVMNFAAIARGYRRGDSVLHFKNTPVHRIVPDFVVQMGDITTGDGTGGRSIYGERFNDENFQLSHRAAGYASMANHGRDTNGSQFFVLLSRARWLDGKHVVFGKVVKGMDVVRILGETPSHPDTAVPKRRVRIVDSGIRNIPRKYKLTKQQMDSDDDIDEE